MRWGRIETESNLVMAPMAGWTDLPQRLLAKEAGAGLVYTEMVSAMGLYRREPKTWSLVRSHPAEEPLVVQIFGSDPEILARAATLLEEAGVRAVDLNLGCPARKVVKTGAGAVLLSNLNRVGQIFRRLRRATGLTLSAKLRSGWSPGEGLKAVEVARMAEAEGLDGLALHPRFGKQGFGGRADWSILTRVVAEVKIPVLGSGDVTGPETAERMLRETGCAGVMIGRAALGRPWIFDQIKAFLAGEAWERTEPELISRAMNRHLGLLVDYSEPRKAILTFRGWAGRYLKGLPRAKAVRQAIYQAREMEEVMDLVNGYFQGLKRAEEGGGLSG